VIDWRVGLPQKFERDWRRGRMFFVRCLVCYCDPRTACSTPIYREPPTDARQFHAFDVAITCSSHYCRSIVGALAEAARLAPLRNVSVTCTVKL
jgi:hypothetical protein